MSALDDFVAAQGQPDRTTEQIDSLWLLLSAEERKFVLDKQGVSPEIQAEFKKIVTEIVDGMAARGVSQDEQAAFKKATLGE